MHIEEYNQYANNICHFGCRSLTLVAETTLDAKPVEGRGRGEKEEQDITKQALGLLEENAPISSATGPALTGPQFFTWPFPGHARQADPRKAFSSPGPL
ncbi:MAG: hypothetical protein JW999_11835 [Methanotrichaceae archaeon]|nr:hypothetical protein [Methanotrichaceae archaeon]